MHALDGSGTGHQSGAREIDVSILPASSILRRAEAELVHELPTGAVIEDDAHSQLERAPSHSCPARTGERRNRGHRQCELAE